jgi:hypothetical protein
LRTVSSSFALAGAAGTAFAAGASSSSSILRIAGAAKAERDALQVTIDAYMLALGDFASSPLGQAMAPKAPVDVSDQPFR